MTQQRDQYGVERKALSRRMDAALRAGKHALAVGLLLAQARKEPFNAVFSRTLSGDLARLQVYRIIRSNHPQVSPERLRDIVETQLTRRAATL